MRTTGNQENETTGQLDRTAGLRENETTGQLDNGTTGIQDNRKKGQGTISGQWDIKYKTTGQGEHLTMEQLDNWTAFLMAFIIAYNCHKLTKTGQFQSYINRPSVKHVLGFLDWF